MNLTHEDYLKIRGSALRSLRAELRLLQDGLDALRLPTPKTYVAVDHLERAIDGLTGTVHMLETHGN